MLNPWNCCELVPANCICGRTIGVPSSAASQLSETSSSSVCLSSFSSSDAAEVNSLFSILGRRIRYAHAADCFVDSSENYRRRLCPVPAQRLRARRRRGDCCGAKVTKRTLYHHFESKDALLTAVLEQQQDLEMLTWDGFHRRVGSSTSTHDHENVRRPDQMVFSASLGWIGLQQVGDGTRRPPRAPCAKNRQASQGCGRSALRGDASDRKGPLTEIASSRNLVNCRGRHELHTFSW